MTLLPCTMTKAPFACLFCASGDASGSHKIQLRIDNFENFDNLNNTRLTTPPDARKAAILKRRPGMQTKNQNERRMTMNTLGAYR